LYSTELPKNLIVTGEGLEKNKISVRVAVNVPLLYFSFFFFRIYSLDFFDETFRIEAHESEILCVVFSPQESGKFS